MQHTTKTKCKEVATSSYEQKLWADRVPLSWKPYIQLARLDLFAGSLLIYWPCTWGLSLVAARTNMQFSRYIVHNAMFLLWSTFLHSVGSTWNDICDRDFDRLVERTKHRPLAVGSISVKAASLWMCPQIMVLIGLLYKFWKNALTLGVFEILVLTTLYPFMKRITHWPQAWLGIAFSWGAIISWVASNPVDWSVMSLLLFTGCSWTIFYDTIYAMMDKKDDSKAGIKSTAVLFGIHARLILSFFAFMVLLGLSFIGLVTHQRLPFFVMSVLGSAIHFTWQITTVDFEDARSCSSRFKSNGTQMGWIISSGMFTNYFLALGGNLEAR